MSNSYKNATEFDRERGRRILKARERAGLSRKDFASEMDIAQSTVSGYESGGSDPKSEGLYKIAKVCDCSVDYLLGLTDNPSSRQNPMEKAINYLQGNDDSSEDSAGLSKQAKDLAVRFDSLRKTEKVLCQVLIYYLSDLSQQADVEDPGNLCYIGQDGRTIKAENASEYLERLQKKAEKARNNNADEGENCKNSESPAPGDPALEDPWR